jgi:hypothetical protein
VIAVLASAGVFVAVPLTGWLALGRVTMPVPAIARPSLWVSAGLAIWSVPLLLSLVLGVYRPELIGGAGWVVAAVIVARRGVARPRFARLRTRDRIVLAGVLLAATLAAAFPADPFISGWDMGTYASHAVYMANHGRLDVPYPWPATESLPPGFLAPGNVFATEPTMTVRFANLWPAWLAQTYAATGYEGLIRLNVVLGLFALLAIYGLARRFVSARIAAVAILFLALNPAQIWVTRQTLSEIPTQLLIWCGLLLLTAYVARGRPGWGLWAGILLGVSAFVRIDALLLVPFLLIGHALWNVLQPDGYGRPRPTWRWVYLGSMPLFGLALAYYGLFSRPYLVDNATEVLAIAALAIAGVIGLALTQYPPVMRLARAALAKRALVIGLLGILAVIALYAYFVRPILPPFAVIDAPGAIFDGARSYIEDALPNLGNYLTPGIVLGALVGWSLVFLIATRRSRSSVLAPLLIIVLGCTAVYVWNQAAWPNHFWAIRRFIPIIIPAMVVFAGAAAAVALARLSRPGRRLAFRVSVIALALYTAFIGLPSYSVAERQGSYAALQEFASALPPSDQIVALDGIYEAWRYWMPLYLAFDRPIVPLDPSTEAGRDEALARLAAASEDHPVTVITAAHDFRMDAVEGGRVLEREWVAPVMAETVRPVPRTVADEHVTLTVIQATGVNTMGVAFGGSPQWVAAVSGLHPAELIDGRPLRWTNGHGRISIPIYGDSAPTRLSISLADTGPDGGALRIALNGATLFDGVVSPGPWSAEFELGGIADIQQGDTADIEIISDVFQQDPGMQIDHETSFGVQVDRVTFLTASR